MSDASGTGRLLPRPSPSGRGYRRRYGDIVSRRLISSERSEDIVIPVAGGYSFSQWVGDRKPWLNRERNRGIAPRPNPSGRGYRRRYGDIVSRRLISSERSEDIVIPVAGGYSFSQWVGDRKPWLNRERNRGFRRDEIHAKRGRYRHGVPTISEPLVSGSDRVARISFILWWVVISFPNEWGRESPG